MQNRLHNYLVQVMVTMSRWGAGEHETVCGEVEVETGGECLCDCGGEEEASCVPGLQYYHLPSCSCVCHNQHQRSQCVARGGSWQPTSCTCNCRPDTWHLCPTGYEYDYMATCSCVLVHTRANISYIIAIILSSSLLLFSLGYVVRSYFHMTVSYDFKESLYFCS